MAIQLITSFIKPMPLRRVVTILLLAVTVWLGSAFSYSHTLQAKTLTPEANSYQVDRSKAEKGTNRAQYLREDLVENSQNQLKNTANNVKEKLKLKEPQTSSQSKVAHQVQEKINEAIQVK